MRDSHVGDECDKIIKMAYINDLYNERDGYT